MHCNGVNPCKELVKCCLPLTLTQRMKFVLLTRLGLEKARNVKLTNRFVLNIINTECQEYT